MHAGPLVTPEKLNQALGAALPTTLDSLESASPQSDAGDSQAPHIGVPAAPQIGIPAEFLLPVDQGGLSPKRPGGSNAPRTSSLDGQQQSSPLPASSTQEAAHQALQGISNGEAPKVILPPRSK